MNSNLYLLTESEGHFLENPQQDLINLFNSLPDASKYTINPNLANFVFPKHFSLTTSNAAPHYIADSTSSALDLAHFLVKKDCFPPFSSVICRSQTEGRGQLKRAWASVEGNLYFALALPNTYPFNGNLASPLIGALLAKALENKDFNVKLKWPNDIIQQKFDTKWKKIAGILLEERNSCLIAGIGINLSAAPASQELRTDYFMAADILEKEKSSGNIFEDLINFNQKENTYDGFLSDNLCDYNVLSSDFLKIWQFGLMLVDEIFLCYRELLLSEKNNSSVEINFSDFIENFLAFKGEKVKIVHPILKEDLGFEPADTDAQSLEGTVCGIASDGELLVQTNKDIVTILGGSFSPDHK